MIPRNMHSLHRKVCISPLVVLAVLLGTYTLFVLGFVAVTLYLSDLTTR